MNNETVRRIQISIDEIDLDVENPRFEKVNSQEEALHVMLTEYQSKIYNLAKHITENGMNPTELSAVIKSNDNRYIILDGNRRLSALKILSNPDLITDDFNSLKTKITKLDRSNIPTYINAIDFPNEEEANLWINLKHTGENDGISTVAWNSIQQSRFNNNKYPLSSQLLNYMEGSKMLKSTIAPKIKDLKITNLERLLSDPDVRKSLSISKKGNTLQFPLPNKTIEAVLNNLLEEILAEDFTVNKIFYKTDRADFMSCFKSKYNWAEDEIETLKNHKTSPVNKNGNNLEKNSKNQNSRKDTQNNKGKLTVDINFPKTKTPEMPSTQDRHSLIPENFNLTIMNSKVNDIYKELKKISVNSYPNLVGASFRVFLELSIDLYIDKFYEEINANSNDKFKNKLGKVKDHMKTKLNLEADQLKDINRAISSNDNIISIDTLHGYIHSTIAQASGDGLKTTWNNYEMFFELLYQSLNYEPLAKSQI